jgi:transketolase
MRKQFVKSMQEILYSDEKSVLLLGDIGVFGFREEIKNIPSRVYNIGILEQSMVSLASGMARGGLTPFMHTIAPFMVERALEQIKVDFGYQELNGNFISVGGSYDYAGLGCTHHCPGDINMLLGIPGMNIYVPGTSSEFDKIIKQSYKLNCPKYFRLSERENEFSVDSNPGSAVLVKEGSKALIICYGTILSNVLEATREMDVSVLYYNTIMPFDKNAVLENFRENIIICEPFYEGSTNFLITNALLGKKCSIFNIGVPRMFLHNYGDKKQHDHHLMLDADGIKRKVSACLT